MSDQPCPSCGGTTGFFNNRGTIDVCEDPWHGEQEAKAPFPKYPHETWQSMAEIGEAFMDAMPKGYIYNQSPAEIIADLTNERDDARKALFDLLALDETWPLRDVLDKLRSATSHLLSVHGCDAHGHEEFKAAMMQAETLIVRIDPAMLAVAAAK